MRTVGCCLKFVKIDVNLFLLGLEPKPAKKPEHVNKTDQLRNTAHPLEIHLESQLQPFLRWTGQQGHGHLFRLFEPQEHGLGGPELSQNLGRTVRQNVGKLIRPLEGDYVGVLHPGRLPLGAEEEDVYRGGLPAQDLCRLFANGRRKDEGRPVGIALHQRPHQVAGHKRQG